MDPSANDEKLLAFIKKIRNYSFHLTPEDILKELKKLEQVKKEKPKKQKKKKQKKPKQKTIEETIKEKLLALSPFKEGLLEWVIDIDADRIINSYKELIKKYPYSREFLEKYKDEIEEYEEYLEKHEDDLEKYEEELFEISLLFDVVNVTDDYYISGEVSERIVDIINSYENSFRWESKLLQAKE